MLKHSAPLNQTPTSSPIHTSLPSKFRIEKPPFGENFVESRETETSVRIGNCQHILSLLGKARGTGGDDSIPLGFLVGSAWRPCVIESTRSLTAATGHFHLQLEIISDSGSDSVLSCPRRWPPPCHEEDLQPPQHPW